MDYVQIICFVCGAAVIVRGILMALGVPFFTGRLRRKYEEESVRAFCRKNVWSEVVFGAGFILEAIRSDGIFGLTAMVLCALGVALTGMCMRILKAK